MDLMERRARALVVMGLTLVLGWSASVRAQSDPAIAESAMRDPWVAHLKVLESLPTIGADRNLAGELAELETALGEYERQVDRVIDRIVGDPQFAYVADETSRALAQQLAQVQLRFAAVYGVLDIGDRANVRAAQSALDALRATLAAEKPFEKDVLQALGSGSRQQIVGLATRWWNGEEQAIAVKKAVGALARASGQ